MDARQVAKLNGLGRVAIGTSLAVAPGLVARHWIGSDGSRTGARMLTAAVGARDVAIGLGALLAVRGRAPVRGWLGAAALADAADAVVTLAAWGSLPARSRAGVLAMAGGSAVACALAARSAE